MKHLKKFNEAIIDYKSDNIEGFYRDCLNYMEEHSKHHGHPNDDFWKKEAKSKIKKWGKYWYGIPYSDFREIGEKNNVEVVDYNTFFKELPDSEKEGAPPNKVPFFALVNPTTNKSRVVYSEISGKLKVSKEDLDHIYHMLKHENIHIGQKSRRDKGKGEGMNVKNRKEYFSNKDEIMAFAQSVSDLLMKYNPKSPKEALENLNRVPIWNSIKTYVDNEVLKRYKKYIYLYLEREFENGAN